jgi:prepilin-type N-terminal cleavage/methylation domain-containing protein
MKSDKCHVTGDKMKRATRPPDVSRVTRHPSGFTLIELLVVISILGILAGLTVPALKNIGKSQVNISASRQLLDAVARARQLAISQRTTVYMVFVPTNFWMVSPTFLGPKSYPNAWWTGLTPAQTNAAVNLCGEQLSGYNFVAYGAMGDQPGQHAWHYLWSWQTLPEGSFVALQKFAGTNTITDPITFAPYPIDQFRYTNNFPFPTETSPTGVWLPYLAFDYRGQLVSEVDVSGNCNDAYIPLAHGSVLPAINPNTRALQVGASASPDVAEAPPGNSTNISYNIVHINWLTGRAVLERHKMGP